MYKYVLFDLDGTLTDSAPGIINCIKYACGKMGLLIPSDEVLLSFVGPPLKDMMAKVFSLSDSDSEKMVAFYRERFSTVGLFENSVYPGVTDMLKRVKDQGLKTALATSKPKVFAERICDKFGLVKYLDVLEGSLLSGEKVKKEDVMRSALFALGADREKSIMVGDRSFDIEAAKKLKTDSLAVTYGYAEEGEIRGSCPTYTASTPEEAADIILRRG